MPNNSCPFGIINNFAIYLNVINGGGAVVPADDDDNGRLPQRFTFEVNCSDADEAVSLPSKALTHSLDRPSPIW